MLLISTILYFEEEPIGYQVYKEASQFCFVPAPDSQGSIIPPVIWVWREGDQWKFTGTEAVPLQEEVVRILDINELINLSGDLSAAP